MYQLSVHSSSPALLSESFYKCLTAYCQAFGSPIITPEILGAERFVNPGCVNALESVQIVGSQ
jgi:hypothetical protein